MFHLLYLYLHLVVALKSDFLRVLKDICERCPKSPRGRHSIRFKFSFGQHESLGREVKCTCLSLSFFTRPECKTALQTSK